MSVINTNVKALTAQASLSNVNKTMATAMERLSTGSRINSAKDDAAGMAISLRMTSDIRGFAVAIRNANDGISMSQTAEGGLGQINDMLQRMRELAVQSSNGSASADNRAASQLEVTQLKQEIDNIAQRTNFNGIKLLDGTAAKLDLQTGVNAGDMMTMQIDASGTKDLGVGSRSSLTATGFSGAQGSLKNIAAGDLTINGVAVGASSALSDNVSTSGFEAVTMSFAAGGVADTKTVIFDGVTITAGAGGVGGVANDSNSASKAAAVVAKAYNDSTNAKNFTAAVNGSTVVFTAKTAGNLAAFTDSGTSADTTLVTKDGGSDKSSSAIAKVAAINLVSDQTGVTATVVATTVSGSDMSSPAIGSGKISINGVSTSTFSTTADAGISRANTVAAINLISAQTGVRAVDTGDLKKGVVLIAEDGRNISTSITQASGSFTAGTTGVGASAVTSGGYTLTSTSGAPIVVGSTNNGTVANAGLSAGSYEANVSVITTTNRAVGATSVPPSASTTGVLAAGTMRINGVSIDAAVTADDTASSTVADSSTKAASAIAIAAAINKKSDATGVTAKAEANVVVGTSFTAVASTDAILTLNGVAISLVTTASTTRGDVATEINNFSGQTGVVASDNGRGLTMTAADGRNISMSYRGGVAGTNAAAATDLGLLASAVVTSPTAVVGGATADKGVTTYARVSLSSDLSFKIEGGSDGNQSLESLGFKTGTVGGSDNGVKVASVDVSTQAGAQLAIKSLDAAMKSVSMSQAQLGAFQNRLDAVVSNLTVANLNMSASRSRIQDTDYATESTNLAKSQIISQAATAMLAQANQSAQGVLALLK